MTIPLTCPSCGHQGKIRDDHPRKRVRCPKCGAAFQVPAGKPRTPTEVPPDPTSGIRKRRWPLVAGAAALVAAGLGAGAFLWFGRVSLSPPPGPSEQPATVARTVSPDEQRQAGATTGTSPQSPQTPRAGTDAAELCQTSFSFSTADAATAPSAEDLRPDAERGDPNAQQQLGNYYYYGHGVQQDYAEAQKWLRAASEQGQCWASFALGQMYEEGAGVPQDFAESMRWTRLAAEQGNPIAKMKLAMLTEVPGMDPTMTPEEIAASMEGMQAEAEALKHPPVESAWRPVQRKSGRGNQAPVTFTASHWWRVAWEFDAVPFTLRVQTEDGKVACEFGLFEGGSSQQSGMPLTIEGADSDFLQDYYNPNSMWYGDDPPPLSVTGVRPGTYTITITADADVAWKFRALVAE